VPERHALGFLSGNGAGCFVSFTENVAGGETKLSVGLDVGRCLVAADVADNQCFRR
jgi:hypothetical protein